MAKWLHVAAGVDLPVDLITESNGILGKKGSGKTTAGVDLVEEINAAGVPFVVVDPKGDWYGIRASKDVGQPGIPVPVFGGLHGDIPLEPTAGAYLAALVRSENLSAVLDVSEFTIADRARFLTAFADTLYRFDSKEPLHLVLEEAHEYIPQRVDSGDAKMVGVFERLVKLGRWKGIGITMMTQRSASLNKNVLTQIDNLFMMRTTSPQDRTAVKAWIDTHADSADILNTLPSLQTGEAWLWQPTRGEPIRFRFRERGTYDAGATPKIGEKPRPPATLADVDLVAISAAMAETIEKAKADDPKVLRGRIAELERDLKTEKLRKDPAEVVVREVEKIIEVPALSDTDRTLIETALDVTKSSTGVLDGIANQLDAILNRYTAPMVPAPPLRPRRVDVAVRRPEPSRGSAPDTTRAASNIGQRDADPDSVVLRAGARRMVETLGRMHPLRLTKAQWGTVSHMKTTSGTWSTYLGDIRKLGFLDENDIGYTLTAAGFDYLGGQPDPMTPEELQQHYRKILRAGAVRMLDTIMAAYPHGVTREEIGAATDMVTTSGTFSTYLGDLTRNGLVDKVDGEYFATDVLMKGAAA